MYLFKIYHVVPIFYLIILKITFQFILVALNQLCFRLGAVHALAVYGNRYQISANGIHVGADLFITKGMFVTPTPLTRFFGGSPGWVLVRLVLLSVVVGLIFSALGIHFDNLFEIIRSTFLRIWDLGYEVIEKSLTYFLLGAAVVFPIWLILRTTKFLQNPKPSKISRSDSEGKPGWPSTD